MRFNGQNSVFFLKNERKLHSLLSPLNLNLNYENFCFRYKSTAFIWHEQIFLQKNAYFVYFSTILPLKVAAEASKTCTWTTSPIFWLERGKTTVLYCSVRPYISSRLRLEKPSTSTSTVFPISRRLDSSESWFCSAIISLIDEYSWCAQMYRVHILKYWNNDLQPVPDL